MEKKKVALVTGATGGIGTAICKELAAEGFEIAAHYRSQSKADAWQQDMRLAGHEVRMFQADVCDFDQVAAMVAKIEEEMGTIDVLVNNAGITWDGAFRKMTPEQWRSVISTNLDSVFNCTRAVINPMIEQKYGRIVNISSVNGQKGQFGQANYSAAKAGMHGFTKTLAMETASKGVTVNTVSPGYVNTEMVQAIAAEVREKIVAGIPAKRLAEPREIAGLVKFLVGPDAGFITGANYAINGGQHVY